MNSGESNVSSDPSFAAGTEEKPEIDGIIDRTKGKAVRREKAVNRNQGQSEP